MEYKYGLLGKKLSHSFSPMLHKDFGGYEYGLFEKEENEVEDFILNGGFKAINVTIPYKKTVVPYMDELSDIAKRIGSVNVVVRREDGSLYGNNTDYFGLKYLIKRHEVSVEGKKVLILGNGGAAPTVRVLMEDLGASEIVIISRSGENNYENIYLHHDAQVIVNTTPLGMYPKNGESAINPADFKQCESIVDIIFNPLKTKLLLEAEKCGIKVVNGIDMLVAQAAAGCEDFIGKKVSSEKIEAECDLLKSKVENIVLIGMPGSGKTYVGTLLAQNLGREFYDSDVEYNNVFGTTPAEDITANGEEFFRKRETEIISSLSKKSGIVLSTGGGVVTRPENLDYLRQNGAIVYIKRNVGLLATEGRPLTAAKSREVLFAERKALYEGWADYTINNNDYDESIKECAKLAERCGWK